MCPGPSHFGLFIGPLQKPFYVQAKYELNPLIDKVIANYSKFSDLTLQDKTTIVSLMCHGQVPFRNKKVMINFKVFRCSWNSNDTGTIALPLFLFSKKKLS